MKQIIETKNAPQAIGCYSQAVKVENTVYLSGQIPLDPQTMELVDGFENQVHQIFKNLCAVIHAANGTTDNIVKLNIYLLDMSNFSIVNEIMPKYFNSPYPARALVGVRQLPKGADIEADAIMVLD